MRCWFTMIEQIPGFSPYLANTASEWKSSTYSWNLHLTSEINQIISIFICFQNQPDRSCCGVWAKDIVLENELGIQNNGFVF
jgi:hypothetical protein